MKKRRSPRRSLSAAMILPAVGTATADDTLKTLGEFRQSGWHGDWPTIPQTGPKADQVKKNLAKITLPPGFHIGLYALVPDARHMAVGPQGIALFVGTRKTKVYVVTDRDRNFVADEVKEFAPSLAKKIPNGPCFSKDGFLFIVEQNRVLMYPAAEFFYESPDVVAVPIVPEGQLIPKEEESYNHTARECRIGPDNKLYIQLGQPFNVPANDKWAIYHKRSAWAASSAWTATARTARSTRPACATRKAWTSIRRTSTLWSNDNQVDGMGDDKPPGEMNRVTKAGQDFGFPYYGGGHTRTDEYAKDTPPKDIVFPEVEQVAHAADLGLTFYTGNQFPAKYHGAIFSDPARLVESHRAGRRPGHGHLPEAGWPCRGPLDPVCRGLERSTASTMAVRSTWRSFMTARCSSPTTSWVRSIVSGTTANKRRPA